jgi:UDPglucose 6-dehydrogenase
MKFQINEESKFRLAIVGHGFVGKAVDFGFEHTAIKKLLVDPKYGNTIDDLEAFEPNLTFVCVPTPMKDNGRVDASLAEDAVLKALYHTSGGVALKSTVTPDVLERLLNTISTEDKTYLNRFVYNPEFLTESNAMNEFVCQPFMILGGEPGACQALENLYHDFSCVSCDNYVSMSAMEASLAKYTVNSFLALKVAFFNQIYDVCDENALFYTGVMRGVLADPRIGHSHTKVPGFDMKRGFGGACFPKDTKAITSMTDALTILEEAIKVNDRYRINYDLSEREKDQNVNYGQAKEEQ